MTINKLISQALMDDKLVTCVREIDRLTIIYPSDVSRDQIENIRKDFFKKHGVDLTADEDSVWITITNVI